MKWFTSDLHFFHKNILKFTNRPVSSVEEMHDTIINNWNAVVQPTDIVYHLGDLNFSKPHSVIPLLERLNGEIQLLQGNHDSDNAQATYRKLPNVTRAQCSPYLELKEQGQKIILCHYPIAAWRNNHHGSWHLFGHCHGSYHPEGKTMDASIDAAWNNYGKFRPLSFDEIKEIMDTKSIHVVDRHEPK